MDTSLLTTALTVLLLFESVLFSIFTGIMFGSQLWSVWTDMTVSLTNTSLSGHSGRLDQVLCNAESTGLSLHSGGRCVRILSKSFTHNSAAPSCSVVWSYVHFWTSKGGQYQIQLLLTCSPTVVWPLLVSLTLWISTSLLEWIKICGYSFTWSDHRLMRCDNWL